MADKKAVKISIIGLFIWVSLWAPATYAQVKETPTNAPWIEMASDAHLKLRLYSSLKRTQKRIDLSVQQVRAKNLPENEFLDAWSKEFRQITQDYVHLQMQQNKWDTRQMSAVKRKLSKLNWRAFGEIFLSQTKHLKTFLRHRGPGVFGAVVLTNILQLVFPFVLAALGHNPMWAAVLLKIPTNLPVIFAYQVVENQFYKVRLMRELGGQKEYQKFVKLNKKSLDGLNLKNIQDHILPLDAKGDAVAISRPRPILSLLQMLGFKKEELTLHTVKDFMIKHNIDDPLAWGFMNDDQLATQDRLAMIVTHFHDQLSARLKSKFRLRFSESFTTIRNAPVQWRSTSSWVENVLKSKSTQDIFEQLERLPAHLKPQELSEIWDQVLLPELARSEQLSYKQIRRLIKDFHSFKIKTFKFTNEEMTLELREEFLRYFRNALAPSSRDCFNTHRDVLLRLMTP